MTTEREPQLAYSELMGKMLDEEHRRTKARKMLSVVRHFLGRDDLKGMTVADIGCSAGFIADELAKAGAETTYGFDIDAPGLEKAKERFGEQVKFVNAPGEKMPLPDESLDLVVFNHIYEHVVDPDAVIAEVHRVLKPEGVVYLGLANKFQPIEPHYNLPLLSWLPQGLADRYIRAAKKADSYYEKHRSRGGLKKMLDGFHVWDYTFCVIKDPVTFQAGEIVKGPISKVPTPVLRLATQIVPTYVWIGTKSAAGPRGAELTPRPGHLRTP